MMISLSVHGIRSPLGGKMPRDPPAGKMPREVTVPLDPPAVKMPCDPLGGKMPRDFLGGKVPRVCYQIDGARGNGILFFTKILRPNVVSKL